MRQWIRKIHVVVLAAFVALGTSTLLPVVAANPVPAQDYVLSKIQSVHTESTSTTTSLPANTEKSGNWGGYIATPTSGQGYTRVSGSWTVPTITATQANALAAQWIGLGGVSTSDLLQIGTIESIENGQPKAELFWEKLPDAAQSIVTVPIGSTVTASIAPEDSTDTVWNLTYTVNIPDGQTQTNTIKVTLEAAYAQEIGTSAEWISEDPSNQKNQLYPLANMGIVKYNSARVDDQPLNASGNKVTPVAMVSKKGDVLIAPSVLGSDGESFSTTVLATQTENGNNTSTGKSHYRRPTQLQQGHMPHYREYDFSQNGWSWSWTWNW
ncbi:G1 family glutamic endopeptidase [Desulfitobacterium sp. Sab5]|uniref:G1 family glutamic endopeptidase n=1 Tax=Desulfitobacterium nosdiversum TaxID=3375356 RepID=UPI003CF7E08C